MSPRARQRKLIAAALICAGVAAVLFAQYLRRPPPFEPPAEDVCIVPPSRASHPHPFDPASGLARHAARPVPQDARCPVCGMYPARFKQWAAQLIFRDGGAHFFDSPVDLFMFLAEPARFDARYQAGGAAGVLQEVAALHVSDHGGRGWIDARAAFYIAGSRVRGPMRGPDLPAFADAAAASAFAIREGGQVLAFGQVDAALLRSLRDANHARHMH